MPLRLLLQQYIYNEAEALLLISIKNYQDRTDFLLRGRLRTPRHALLIKIECEKLDQ